MTPTAMAKKHTFKAKLEEGQGGGVFVRVPFDVEEVFGKKRVPITATIDGEPYRGTLVRMGLPDHCLGVLKAIREKICKQVGDDVRISLEEDTAERKVVVPADLTSALRRHKEARAFFETLSYTHQKEYVQWIEDAKKEQTRKTRVERTVEMLAASKKTK
jgi:hypothetical protein